jgi:hypothetical protein
MARNRMQKMAKNKTKCLLSKSRLMTSSASLIISTVYSSLWPEKIVKKSTSLYKLKIKFDESI